MSTSYSWEGKGRYGLSRLRMNVWVCKYNCEILENTCHTWAPLRWWFTTKRRYIKCMDLYLNRKSYALYRTVTFPMTLTDPNPVFKVTAFLKSTISKRCILGTKLLKNTNRKQYPIYRMVPLSMTLSDRWPEFQGQDIFWSQVSEKLKDSYYCTLIGNYT